MRIKIIIIVIIISLLIIDSLRKDHGGGKAGLFLTRAQAMNLDGVLSRELVTMPRLLPVTTLPG